MDVQRRSAAQHAPQPPPTQRLRAPWSPEHPSSEHSSPEHGGRSSKLQTQQLSDPDDASFAALDDHVLQLLQSDDRSAALRYLGRMRSLLDTVCDKLALQLPEDDPMRMTWATLSLPRSALGAAGAGAPGRGGSMSARGSARSARPPASRGSSRGKGGVSARRPLTERGQRSRGLPSVDRRFGTGTPDSESEQINPPRQAFGSTGMSREQVDVHANRLKEQEKQTKELKSKLVAFDDKLEARDDRISELKGALDTTSAKLRRREESAKELVMRLRMSEREFDRRSDEVIGLRSQLEQMQTVAVMPVVSLEAWEDKLQEVGECYQAIGQLEGKLTVQAGKAKLMEQKVSKLGEQAELGEQAVHLHKEAKVLKERLKSKEAQVLTSNRRMLDTDKSAKQLQAETKVLRAQFDTLKANEQRLGKAGDKMRKNLDVALEECAKFRQKAQALNSELREAGLTAGERDALLIQLTDLESEANGALQKKEQLEGKVKAAGVELHKCAKEMGELQGEVLHARKELKDAMTQVFNYRRRIDPMKAEIASLTMDVKRKRDFIENAIGPKQKLVAAELEKYKDISEQVPTLEADKLREMERVKALQLMLTELKAQYAQKVEQTRELGKFVNERNIWARKTWRLTLEPLKLKGVIRKQRTELVTTTKQRDDLVVKACVQDMVNQVVSAAYDVNFSENNRRRKRIAVLEREAEYDEGVMSDQASTIESQADELKKLLAEIDQLRVLREIVQEVEALEELLAKERKVKETTQERLAQEEAKSANLHARLSTELQRNEPLQEELTDVKAAFQAASDSLDETRSKLQLEIAKVQILEEEKQQAAVDAAAAAAEKDVLVAEKRSLQEMEVFLNEEVGQLKELHASEVQTVRQCNLVIQSKIEDLEQAEHRRQMEELEAQDLLDRTIRTLTQEMEDALAAEREEKETLMQGMVELVDEREQTIMEHKDELHAAADYADRQQEQIEDLELNVQFLESELAEAVVPLVVTEEEQRAVAETVEEMIALLELMDGVPEHQTHLYLSGAATAETPYPSATPEPLEQDYSRPLANPVVSVREVRGKRLYSI